MFYILSGAIELRTILPDLPAAIIRDLIYYSLTTLSTSGAYELVYTYCIRLLD